MNIFAAQEKDKERMQTNQWRHRQTSGLQVANHLTFGTLRLMLSPKSLGDGTNQQRRVDWFFPSMEYFDVLSMCDERVDYNI